MIKFSTKFHYKTFKPKQKMIGSSNCSDTGRSSEPEGSFKFVSSFKFEFSGALNLLVLLNAGLDEL